VPQTDFNRVLRHTLRDSARLVNCERCSILLLDPAGKELVAKVFDETPDVVGGTAHARRTCANAGA